MDIHEQPLESIDITSRIEQEALDLLHNQLTYILFGTLASSTFAYLGIRNIVTTPVLALWLGLVYLSSTIRFVTNRLYFDKLAREHLKLFFVLGSLVSGVLWGSLPILASGYNNLLAMSISAIIVSCMAAAALAGLSPYPRSYYAYAFPAILGMALGFSLYDIPEVKILIILSLFYLLVIVSFCNNIHRTTINAIRLRLENEALLDEVRKQAHIAEKANIDKSRFLAAASHDLRQPFHALGLFVSAIKDKNLDEETRGIVDNIRSSIGVLERMFTELLDVSRLDAGAVTPHSAHFSTLDLIRELREEFQTIASEKGLDFNYTDVDEVVYSDSLLCERILRNILSNAFNYTNEGGVNVSVTTDRDNIIFAVSDTGIGIEEGKHEQIFSEFEQLQNPERDRNKGLGLGLAIVKRLCNLLGLTITVQSSPGQGSTFTVMLPRGERQKITLQSPDIAATDPPKSLGGKKILVIDDDQMVLKGMKAQLESWQCQGWYVTTDEEAKVVIREQTRPDLIICDYRLRDDKTGLALISELNAMAGKTIPSIIITGDTDPEIIKVILANSDSVVLHKPVQGGRLRLALTSLL